MKPIRLFPSALVVVWIILFSYFMFNGFFKKDAHSESLMNMRSHIGRAPYNNTARRSSYHVKATCKDAASDVEVAPAYSMPLIALASFPRSGNTWSRSLIQVATKYSTGSVHWRTERQNGLKEWFKAGSEDYMLRKGVCVKTHFYSPPHIPTFDGGAILLLRNPYYSLVSEFLRFFSRVENVSTPEILRDLRKRDERWQTFLPTYAKKWRDTAMNWITHCKRLIIVFYEDLEESPVYEVTRMVAFLGQPVQPRRIQCAVHLYPSMKGHTNHSSHMTFDPYTEEMHGIVDRYIAEVNQTLINMNVTPLPVYEKYFLPS